MTIAEPGRFARLARRRRLEVADVALHVALGRDVTRHHQECGRERDREAGPTDLAHAVVLDAVVAGLEPDSYYREALAPNLGMFAPLLRFDVNRQDKEVTASLAGVFRSRAIYRGAEGCLVVQGPTLPPAVAPPPTPSLLPPIAGPEVVTPTDPALIAALDHEFADPGPEGPRITKAVVIVHDGRIVAERYALGYGTETPILGWSTTKAVTNALVGIQFQQRRICLGFTIPAQ